MKKICSLIFLFTIAIPFCFAQYRIVSGSVYAFKDSPLMNIQITAKKAKTSVHSDSLGNFNIACAEKDKLVFSGNGFAKLSKKVNKLDTIRVKMYFVESEKNKKLAIDNGHILKEDLAYSISRFSNYNNDYSNFSDIFSLILSKFPGVQIVKGDDLYKKVVIRGTKSFQCDSYALYVVNGVVTDDIQYIAPYNIKDIEILKEATIYGARGANGAIIITVGN